MEKILVCCYSTSALAFFSSYEWHICLDYELIFCYFLECFKHECENFVTWFDSSLVSKHKARCFHSIIKKTVIVFVFTVDFFLNAVIFLTAWSNSNSNRRLMVFQPSLKLRQAAAGRAPVGISMHGTRRTAACIAEMAAGPAVHVQA